MNCNFKLVIASILLIWSFQNSAQQNNIEGKSNKSRIILKPELKLFFGTARFNAKRDRGGAVV